MVDIVLKIALCLSPVIWGINTSLNKIDSIFFILSCMALFLASLFDNPKRNVNISIPALSLFGLCLFNLFTLNFSSLVLGNTVNIFLGILALWVILNYASGYKQFYPFIVIPALLNIFIFIFQKFGYMLILNSSPSVDFGGLLGNAPRLATYLCLILVVSLEYSWLMFGLCILASLVMTEYTLIGVTLLLILYRIKNTNIKRLFTICSGLALISIYKPILTALKARIDIWKGIIDEITKRPLLGYGLGAGTDFFNEYLHIWYAFGFLGLVWLGYVIYKHRKIQYLLILPFLILCLTEYPLGIPRLWLTLISLIAFTLIKNHEEVKC
jgi:hypothetical protein